MLPKSGNSSLSEMEGFQLRDLNNRGCSEYVAALVSAMIRPTAEIMLVEIGDVADAYGRNKVGIGGSARTKPNSSTDRHLKYIITNFSTTLAFRNHQGSPTVVLLPFILSRLYPDLRMYVE